MRKLFSIFLFLIVCPVLFAQNNEIKLLVRADDNDVAINREWVTRVSTSEKVKQTIQQKGIKLISYRDLSEK